MSFTFASLEFVHLWQISLLIDLLFIDKCKGGPKELRLGFFISLFHLDFIYRLAQETLQLSNSDQPVLSLHGVLLQVFVVVQVQVGEHLVVTGFCKKVKLNIYIEVMQTVQQACPASIN